MSLHLQKVAVGIKTPADIERWRVRIAKANSASHVTRMWPKRETELLAGGSLYWAVAKKFAIRQRILRLDPVVIGGIKKCRIVLDPEFVPVRATPRRPFQGWRYLEGAKIPPDLVAGTTRTEADLENTLAALGLL